MVAAHAYLDVDFVEDGMNHLPLLRALESGYTTDETDAAMNGMLQRIDGLLATDRTYLEQEELLGLIERLFEEARFIASDWRAVTAWLREARAAAGAPIDARPPIATRARPVSGQWP